MDTDQTTILRLVQEGKLTPQEGAQLLEAMSGAGKAAPSKPFPAAARQEAEAAPRKGKGRFLHVVVKVQQEASEGESKQQDVDVDINVPLALARNILPMLERAIPADARRQIEEQGVDLTAVVGMLQTLDEDMEGRDLVNAVIHQNADEEGSHRQDVRVLINVD